MSVHDSNLEVLILYKENLNTFIQALRAKKTFLKMNSPALEGGLIS